MGQIFSGTGSSILMGIFIIGALIGVHFFITNWDRPVTDATIFSAMLVELPVQYYFQKIKK